MKIIYFLVFLYTKYKSNKGNRREMAGCNKIRSCIYKFFFSLFLCSTKNSFVYFYIVPLENNKLVGFVLLFDFFLIHSPPRIKWRRVNCLSYYGSLVRCLFVLFIVIVSKKSLSVLFWIKVAVFGKHGHPFSRSDIR